MVKIELTVSVKLAWWVIPYLRVLVFLCEMFDAEPDYDKLGKVIRRGTICKGIG